MIKDITSVPMAEIEDIDLALLNEDDLFEDVSEGEVDGLGAVHTKRRRRRGKRARAQARRRGRMTKKARSRLGRRIAKMLPRSKKGRFMKRGSRRRRGGMHGLEDLVLLESPDTFSDEGLGKSRRRRKKSRGRRSYGLSGLANASASLADAEVLKSMPVVGIFQYVGTRGGLEALGGAAIAPVVDLLVSKGLFGRLLGGNKGGFLNPNAQIGGVLSSLTAAVVTWELGKLVGSGNIAKFGAFSILSGLIQRQIVNPWIAPALGLQGFGDEAILFPGKRRYDYATNPLSGLGTVRVPDDQGIGQVRLFENQDLVGLGTVRVPDDQGIGTVRVPDDQGIGQDEEDEGDEGEDVGQYEEGTVEDSEVF